jgi:hypothetical protein
LLFSIVGLYTSDRTPSATVYHAFDPVLAAVPKQSFLAASARRVQVPCPADAVLHPGQATGPAIAQACAAVPLQV